MKLSEAIRLGSMLGPQRIYKAGAPKEGHCALEAADLAVGGDGSFYPLLSCMSTVGQMFRGLLESPAVACPACGIVLDVDAIFVPPTLTWNIVHLNDHHCWTREEIAAWIEEDFEQEESACAPSSEEASVCGATKKLSGARVDGFMSIEDATIMTRTG